MGVKRRFVGGGRRPRKPYRANKKRCNTNGPALARLNARMKVIRGAIETKSGVSLVADGF